MTKNMTAEFIEVNLDADAKGLILELAGFLCDETSLADLKNGRKKWIRFKPHVLPEVIGELSYHFNHSKRGALLDFLDELIEHLEGALSDARR